MGVRLYQSWGRLGPGATAAIRLSRRPIEPLLRSFGHSVLPYGNGRSYGDSCLNSSGILLDCRGLDRFIGFDGQKGVVRCEAGILFSDILEVTVPRGWFLPVTPGTKYVTLGGAIANDVHGKNHHKAGSFGCHVRRLALLRSDGEILECSDSENVEWFDATIGGLGLTGLILWAEIALLPIVSASMDVESERFRTLTDFLAISQSANSSFDYTVAWIDGTARGPSLGRGIFSRASHAVANGPDALSPRRPRSPLALGVIPPIRFINNFTTSLFNLAYYHKFGRAAGKTAMHYDPFFYPLDGLDNWNRLYGPRGLYQYQCVVPIVDGLEAISEILKSTAAFAQGSFLSVLKLFGERKSPGLLSFPRPGITLAIDFANRGTVTLKMLERFDQIVGAVGGAVYPAKDARMSGRMFRQSFPGWEKYSAFVDPRFSSDFWRRVTGDSDR